MFFRIKQEWKLESSCNIVCTDNSLITLSLYSAGLLGLRMNMLEEINTSIVRGKLWGFSQSIQYLRYRAGRKLSSYKFSGVGIDI